MNTKIFKSESISELAKALSIAQSEMQIAKRSSTNPYFHSTYATFADVWQTCREPLTKYGIAIIQLPTTEEGFVSITTLLVHTSGEYIGCELSITLPKHDPHSLGSCISYLKRYGLSAIAGVAAENEDDDAVTVVQQMEQQQQQTYPQQQQPQPQMTQVKKNPEKAYLYDVITNVEKSSKSNAFFISTENAKFSTFSIMIAKKANKLINQKVEIEYIEKNGYKNILAINPIETEEINPEAPEASDNKEKNEVDPF